MSKNNSDFFKEKKPWSKTKDQILGSYLAPYFQKILYTGKPSVYIDGFAGKGKFDDGNDGSPLIALKVLEKDTSNASFASSTNAYFIDLNYSKDLEKNLTPYRKSANLNIISGKFEDNIIPLLTKNAGANVFLYIDPYGIKALDFNLFSKIAKANFYSAELLINFNSFGFLREACRVCKKNPPELNWVDELVEYDKSSADEEDLNRIAGGTYWKEIITKYVAGNFTSDDAEKEIVKQYCSKLQEHYKFVLNMAIRVHEGTQPKYRMVYATNHPDGCVLMADSMYKSYKDMCERSDNGQLCLFEKDVNDDIIPDKDQLKGWLLTEIPIENRRLNSVLAKYFCDFGINATTAMLKSLLKELEKERKISVTRDPAFSPKMKPSTFWSDEKGKKVIVRKI